MKNCNIILIIICLLQALVGSAKPNQNASLHCKAPFLENGDSIYVNLYKAGEFRFYAGFRKTFYVKVINHSVDFTFPVGDRPRYISIRLDKHFNGHNLDNYIVSTGDDITVAFGSSGSDKFFDKLEFSGKGSKFWNLQAKLKKLTVWCFRKNSWKLNTVKENFLRLDSTRNVQLSILDSVKALYPISVMNMLRGDIIGQPENSKFYWCDILFSVPELKDSLDGLIKKMKTYWNPFRIKDYAHDQSFSQSEFLGEGIVSNYNLDSVLMQKREVNIKKGFADLKRITTGELGERVLAYYLYVEKDLNIDPKLLRDGIGYFKNPLFIGVLKDLQNGRLEGATAFEFNLPDSSGLSHKMSDFKGKAVVIDFWFTGCGPCRKLGPIMKELEEKYKDKKIQFITVSIDTKKDMWIKSLKAQNYASSLSLNLYTNGLGEDEAMVDHYRVDSYPTVIVIGKDGRLLRNPNFFLLDDAVDLKDLVAQAAE